jgi:hypothetical protein
MGIPRGYSRQKWIGVGFVLSYLNYKIALRKIAKAELELEKRRPPNSVQANESGEMASYINESDDLYEWKRLIQTDYYRSKADRLLVPMPSFEDPKMYARIEWDKDVLEPRYLTDDGLRAIRAAIREEEKHRRERVSYWFAIAVGLIGSIAGLISAFK